MALVGRSLAFLGQLEEPAVGRLLLHECLNLPVHQEEGFRQFPDCLRALAELEARAGNLGQAEVHLAEADRLVEEFEDGWTTFGVELARARIRWLEGDVEAGRAEGLKIIEGIEELRLAQDSSAGRMGVLAARWEPYLWLAGELLAAHPEPLRPDLELAFDLVERQRAQTLQESLAARLGDLYAHTSNRKPTLALIEETLDEETALLSFQLSLEQGHFGESLGGSWVLVVTREGTRAIPLADRLELEPLVESLVDLGDPSQAEELLMRLYDLVLAEALEALPEGVEELVLIPDGVLHRLPFEILRPVSGAEASVGNRFRISYQPSAGLWLGWKSQPRNVEATNPVLVFADPELPARGSERDPAILSGDPRCEGLPPLAAAREEGRNVLERLGETGHLLQGEEASETALKAESLGRYSILHFAAHACTLPNQPDQSAILLTPGAEREDGRLTSADILDLQRVPPMVVLAACRTADGKLVRGEGVISLVRAFFAAGARVVVASQNDLPDRETSRAVDSFYGYLSEGSSVGEALHRVRRKSIQAGAPASVWGSLRVMGDAEWIPFPWGLREPEPSPSLPAYVPQVAVASLGLLVLSLMGSSYVRRSRRRE
ncbi:MAG: CHAT domain-containing protein [Acidobacteriota bacterium]